ncbi:hypothetical protein IFM89_012443 [Coptis chinensis]|uniref:Reverse transcriptase zinc-binding domain-containing protein n=1 Tax=Coptis chinensis TaxID=261450 RepID=A0A835I7J9_9MAGN|nr:hypothetical protein IFM89_012443 [Coptis chinensis]
MWQLVHELIPTADLLCRRGLTVNKVCSLCECVDEAPMHLFVQCTFARAIWLGLGLSVSVDYYTADTFREWLQYMVKCLEYEVDARRWMSTLGDGLWTIWLARNDIIFNGKPQQPLRCVIKARKMTEIMAAIVDTRIQNGSEKIEINVKWDCPPSHLD